MTKETKTFPVKLLRNYRPADGEDKLLAGTEVSLPVDEAKKLIANNIAVRNDPI